MSQQNVSVTKNYLYNSVHQIILIIIPLLTMPYIARVLGASGVGLAVFTTSIVQYFVFLGTFGNSLYGNRTIAYIKDDVDERSKVFWEIFYLKFITIIVSTIIFLTVITISNSGCKFLYYIQSLNLLAAIVDISWFFAGMEDFKKIALRGIFVRIICLALIFIFVKNSDDVWLYILIIAISSILGNLSIWFCLPGKIKFKMINPKNMTKHIKPSLILFIPQIAIYLYTLLDKTLIGILANDAQVGYYNMASRIITMSMSIIGATGVVLMPKMANNFAKGDIESIKAYTIKSFKFVSFLAFPLAFGIFAVSDQFVPWFFGSDFHETSTLLKMLSPVVIAMAWGNITGNQLLIPMKLEKKYTISVIIGGILSCVLNYLLIPEFLAFGACISLLVAEFSVTASQMLFLRNILETKELFNELWKYLAASLSMSFIIYVIGIYLNSNWYTTLIQVFGGIFVYLFIVKLMKCSTFNLIFDKIKNLYNPIKLDCRGEL